MQCGLYSQAIEKVHMRQLPFKTLQENLLFAI